MMKILPIVTLIDRISNQSDNAIRNTHTPLPSKPITNIVVGLKVSPSFPDIIFPAAYVPIKTVSMAERMMEEYPAVFCNCCFTVE
jgi:hypothetical protein